MACTTNLQCTIVSKLMGRDFDKRIGKSRTQTIYYSIKLLKASIPPKKFSKQLCVFFFFCWGGEGSGSEFGSVRILIFELWICIF